MPVIQPVSDLRSYNEVLSNVREGSPVFLTKNGHGRYVVLDMKDYDRLSAEASLLSELERGRRSGEADGWRSAQDVRSHIKNRETVHA